jgi:hypothetical protein
MVSNVQGSVTRVVVMDKGFLEAPLLTNRTSGNARLTRSSIIVVANTM